MDSVIHTLLTVSRDLSFIRAELTLIAGIIILTTLEVIRPNRLVRAKYLVSLITAGLTLILVTPFPFQVNTTLFHNLFEITDLGTATRIIISIGLVFIILFQWSRKSKQYVEINILILAAALGCLLTVMAKHLLSIFISLELISLSSYALITLNFRKQGYEGAVKYLVFGAISTAISLFGMSLLYGLTGSMELNAIADAWDNVMNVTEQNSFILICILVLAAIFFKLSFFPFHIWTPDAYEGADANITAFLSTLPKIAVFSLFFKISQAIALQASPLWTSMLSVLIIATIAIGNFGALQQGRLKRLFAYSSIAHSGIILLVLFDPNEYSLVYYLTVYMFMNLGIFYIIQLFEEQDIHQTTDFRHTEIPHFLISGSLVTFLVALTGLPPTAGFTAKLFIFSGVWNSYASTGNPLDITLLAIAILSVVVSLAYYLKLPVYLFLKPKRQDINLITVQFSTLNIMLATIMALMLLCMFLKPDLLSKLFSYFNITLSLRS